MFAAHAVAIARNTLESIVSHSSHDSDCGYYNHGYGYWLKVFIGRCL